MFLRPWYESKSGAARGFGGRAVALHGVLVGVLLVAIAWSAFRPSTRPGLAFWHFVLLAIAMPARIARSRDFSACDRPPS